MAFVNLRELVVGAKVELADNVIAEVVENPADGMWVMVRFVSCPDDPSREGSEDMVFATDVIDVVEVA